MTIFFFQISCKTDKKEVNKENVLPVEKIEVKKQSDNSELDDKAIFFEKSRLVDSYLIDKDSIPVDSKVEIIDTKCAIFKNPDSKEVEKMKEEYGEDFYVVADDNIFYTSESKTFLDSMKLKQVYLTENRYVQFIDNKGNSIYFDLKGKYSLPWNLLFFDPVKGLKIVDMTNTSAEYEDFYN